MSLCVICNTKLPSPPPTECHFPVAEIDRKILLLGLFRSREINENRVKTLNSIATSSTVLCHSHISKAAWSFFSSVDPSFESENPCDQLKWMLRKSENEVEGRLTLECRPELLDTMRSIYSHLELVLTRQLVLSFVLNAGKCRCDDSLTVDNYEFIGNQASSARSVPPEKEKKRLAGEELPLLPDDIRPIKKSRQSSADVSNASTSSVQPTNEKPEWMDSDGYKALRARMMTSSASDMTSSASDMTSSGSSNTNASSNVPNTSHTAQWNLLSVVWSEEEGEVKWGVVEKMSAEDMEAMEQFMASRGLRMRPVGSSNIPMQRGSTNTSTQDGGPSSVAASSTTKSHAHVSLQSNISSTSAVAMVQTVPPPTAHLTGSSHGNSPIPRLTGSSHGNSGTSGVTSPENSSVKSETRSSSSSSSAESDDEEEESETDEKEENKALSTLKWKVENAQRFGFSGKRNFDTLLNGCLVEAHRFDLSPLHNLSAAEKEKSFAPSQGSGIQFDFLAAALRFSVPPRGTPPINILRQLCVHLISETIDRRFRHLFSSMGATRNSPLIEFPGRAYNVFLEIVEKCYGVHCRNYEHDALRTALRETACKFADQLLAASRSRYNRVRQNDFGGVQKRIGSPCQIAASLHKKRRGYSYDRKFERYFGEAAEFDMNRLWQ